MNQNLFADLGANLTKMSSFPARMLEQRVETYIADRVERLDRFLANLMPAYSRARLAHHIAIGGVRVDGKQRKASFRLQPGMRVDVTPVEAKPIQLLEPAPIPLNVRYEDEHLLVVNKPAGLAVHPSPTLEEPTLVHALLARQHPLSQSGGAYRPGIVHRLDKATSGLLLVAKTDFVHRALQHGIQEKAVRRIYRAIVRGEPPRQEFTIRSYLGRDPRNRKRQAVVEAGASGARLAITNCKVMQVFGPDRFDLPATEIECELETGRTHQIRVHLASVGLPILGDPLYGVKSKHFESQALHAFRLEFDHPMTGEHLCLISQPPWETTT